MAGSRAGQAGSCRTRHVLSSVIDQAVPGSAASAAATCSGKAASDGMISWWYAALKMVARLAVQTCRTASEVSCWTSVPSGCAADSTARARSWVKPLQNCGKGYWMRQSSELPALVVVWLRCAGMDRCSRFAPNCGRIAAACASAANSWAGAGLV